MGVRKKYKIAFWEENRDRSDDPAREEYCWAASRQHAWYLIRLRGEELYRKKGDHSLLSLFGRGDVSVIVSEEKDQPSSRAKNNKEPPQAGVCPKCGEDIDYDYCTECGWQKM